jgi:glycosyltransferase involved in cell wall biosynthesis
MFKPKNGAKIWVVLPAYNEATYLPIVLTKLQKITKHFIVVDDGSSDTTAAVARKFTKNVLIHPVNLGKGAALKTGCSFAFDVCKAKYVVLMDADDQHDPKVLPLFVKSLDKGAEIVLGVRDFKSMPWLRTIGNRLGSVLIWTLFGRYIPDIPSGYKAFSKKAYHYLEWYSLGYSVEMEIAARIAKFKLPVSLVPIPTIYHDFSRGMTVLDTFTMIGYVIAWRISL